MPIVQIGNTSIVNQITVGNQTDPQVTRWADGSVYTYTSVEGGVGVIRLARFNHEGERIGSDIVVSQPGSLDNMGNAFVGRLSSGQIVVTWVDETTGAGFYRVYDGATMVPINGPTQITQSSAINATILGIGFADAGNGNVLFTWTTTSATGDGSGSAIYSRLLGSSLTSFVGNESQTNSTTAGDQVRSRDSLLGNGNFLVTYQSNDGDQNVRGRIVNAATGATVGNDFVINSTTAGDQQRARARLMQDGRTVVVYESDDNGAATLGTNIRIRFLDANGTPTGTDQIINTTTFAFVPNRRAPQAIVMDDGRVVFSWSSFEVSGSGGTQVVMRARIMNADGTFPEGDFSLGQFPANNDIPFAGVRATPDGRLVFTIGTEALATDGSGLSTETRTFVPTTSANDQVLTGNGSGQALNGTSSTASWIDGQGGNDAITMTGSGIAHFYGNAGDDVLTGGVAGDWLFGGTGADAIDGQGGNDRLYGEEGSDTMIGAAGSDTLEGGDGGDTLWGSFGADGVADTLIGGAGSDTYFVYETSDVVTETDAAPATGGIDLVYSFSNRTLGANVENLTLFGNNAALTAVSGNALDNALNAMQYTGGSGITFTDDLGNDIVFASYYNDIISTGRGNDTLWGSWGADGRADAMSGGDGADTYFVQEALDTVTETNASTAASEADTVYSAINMTLGANLEYLFIYGSATIATGNGLNNAIIGSYSGLQLTLSGLAGQDYMVGGGGNDTINGGADVDTLYGSGGADTFEFAVGQANGDVVLDFDGAGAGALDSLRFVGYGAGATFTQINATQWQVNYGVGLASHEIITFNNAASINAQDVVFV